jgi:tetratricopeptide (TPR) repeat protein
LTLASGSRETSSDVAAPSRDSIVNVALATIGTATQAVIQMASDPATAAANPWLAPLGVIVGATAGHEINRLAARVDRARTRRTATDNLLVNEHLAHAMATAIDQRLTAFAAKRTGATTLAKIARRADEWWPQLIYTGVESTKGLDDREFARRVAEHLAGRASKAPAARDWRVVLDVAASFTGHDLDPNVAEAASEALAEHFMSDAVEALKLDFAQDGQAFARVSLTFFAEIFFEIQDLGVTLEAHTRTGQQTLDVAQRTLDAIQSLASAVGAHALNEEVAARQARRSPEPPSHIPTELPRRPTGGTLVGRHTLRSILADRLRKRLDTYVVGPAGFGKTAVAGEAIRDVVGGESEEAFAKSVYPDGVVLLDLYTLRRGDLIEAWSHLAHSFGAPEVQDQSPRDRARNACVGKRALVIVEGAEEAGSDLGSLLAVLSPEAVRLVLTRDPAQATIVHQRLELIEELSRDESCELLNTTCPEIGPDVADRVYTALGGHPLALTWAGAALADPTGDVESLLGDLEAAHLPGLHEPGYETHTLKWLYERGVRRLSDDARRILAAIASLAHGAFPLAAVEAVFGEPDARKRSLGAVRALARAAFIVKASSRQNEWTISHALAYRFGRDHYRVSVSDIEQLGNWCAKSIESAVALRTSNDLSPLRDALRHADALLRNGRGEFGAFVELVALLRNHVGSVTQVGSVDIARSAVRSVEVWLENLSDPVRATVWVNRERGVTCIMSGDVAKADGDLAAALGAYEAALNILTTLVEQDTSNVQLRHDLSVSHDRIGNVLSVQGDQAGALVAFRKGLAIDEELAAGAAANVEWQRNISVSQHKIGDVLVVQGDGAGALVAFRQALAIAEALVAHAPANDVWQRDLSISFERVGDVLVMQGDTSGALVEFRKGLAIRETLVARDPANTQWQRDLSIGHERMGDVSLAQGDAARALAAFRKALAIRETLAARDPANTGWQHDLSLGHDRMGNVWTAQGDLGRALAAFRKGLAIREALAARDPANTDWQRDLSYVCTKLASLHEQSGEYVDALRLSERSLVIDERLSALNPLNAIWQQDVRVSRAQVERLQKLIAS